MTTVISIENLSKSYHLGQIGTGTLSHDLNIWWAKVRGKPNPMLKIGDENQGNRDGETLWALKDVNFTVEQGEALGIIGRNGAGKSTILKILSRVTAPTSGHARVKGRIASLLEVGTGFHPDLTGRENTYLNGAILGMRREEVRRKFDEIVDFAGIEQFIDTPVKRYSSGMYVRLAFAVAAHLDPEILVVDEVLAVGDAAFQKKCLGKMGDVAKEGRTVLFVSHNMGAISSLTNRAILLNGGMIQFNGNTNQAVHEYLSTTYHHGTEWHRNERTNNPMEIIRAKVTSDGIDESNEFDVLKDILVSVEYVVRQPVRGAVIAVILHAWDGAMLFSTEDTDTIPELLFIRETGYYSCVVTIPGGWLNKGDYHIRLGCGIPYQQNFDNIEAFHFTLIDTGNQLSRGHRTGAYLLPTLNWDVKHTSTPVDVTLP